MDGITSITNIVFRERPWIKEQLTKMLAEAEKRFRRARDQVGHIDRKIHGLERRYTRARDGNRRAFRYVLRMRLMTVERSRDMYQWYARAKADEVLALRLQLGDAREDDITEFVDENDSEVEGEEDDDDVEMTPEDDGDQTGNDQ